MANTKATVANGQSLSGAVRLGQDDIVGLVMPASWTSAGLTLQGSLDGTNFFNVYDNAGAEVSLTVDAGRFIAFRQDFIAMLAGLQWVKLRSGTSGAAVNQGGARDLYVVTAPPR